MQDSVEHMAKVDTMRLRKRHVGEACELFYKSDPLKIVRAEQQYMFDERGLKYLDCINNVAHVGHCQPDVVKAGCQQMAILNTNNRFLHDNLVLCARKLTSLLPEPLSVCFFVNSGSEANDLALQLARTHSGHTDIVTLDHAYHGHLATLIDISPYKFNLPGGKGQRDWVHVAACPDGYRGKHRLEEAGDEEALGQLYAEEVRALCKQAREKGRTVAGYISESLQSCGGQIMLPTGYLRAVYKHVREAGGVCIADEVQTGFGRVGKHWWAFQLQGEDVIPDIVTVGSMVSCSRTMLQLHSNVCMPGIVLLGKPMGNGHPVAAVITTREIAKSFQNTGVEYFNTYGGNPVSCAIALAVIDVVERDNLREHATRVGNHLLNSLRQLASKHAVIGDVRGIGLFVGIELVKDRVTRQPATEAAFYVVNRLREERILMSRDGPDCNVLKMKPPMVFSQDNADHVVAVLDEILAELRQGTELPDEKISSESERPELKKLAMDASAYNGGDTERKITMDEAETILLS